MKVEYLEVPVQGLPFDVVVFHKNIVGRVVLSASGQTIFAADKKTWLSIIKDADKLSPTNLRITYEDHNHS